MLADRSLSSQMELTGHVFIREIAIENETKAPDVSLSIISELTQFSEDLPILVEHFSNQLKAVRL